MDIKEEEILGGDVGNHWYYASKARALQSYLPARHYAHVLDIGAGSGFFSRYLLEEGMADEATCVDIGYETEREERVAGRRLSFVRSTSGGTHDLMLLMDVLEHVEDDVGLLASYAKDARTGTDVFISVPAFPFLWSGHDVFLEHYRRYTVPHMTRVVEQAGLSIVNCTYGFGAVFPLAVARRTIGRWTDKGDEPQSDLQRHSPLVNGTLKMICAAERPFQKLNRVAGLSVYCLAKKG